MLYIFQFRQENSQMRSVRYGLIQPNESNTTLMLNDNIPNTALLRSSKGLRKKNKKLYPLVLAIIFTRRVRKCIKKRKMREKVLQQWYQTQNSYYLDLWVMANWIKRPLQELRIINLDQSLVLFPQIEDMLKLSQMMIAVLDKALKQTHPNKIVVCKQILSFVNAYRIYGGYFNYHHKSSIILSQLSSSNQVQMKQIESRMQQEFSVRQSKKQALTLKDCMQQPFYRLFKYALLVKEYSKKLPKFHPDYEYSINCNNCFRQINSYYNELMKKVQEKQKKKKLYNMFGDILNQQNVFVTEVQASTSLYDVKVYIFNQILMVTKITTHLGCQKQEKYNYYELNEFSYIGFQDNLKYFKNCLILIGKKECLHLFFPDDPSRVQFYRCITKIIRQLRIVKHQQRVNLGRLSFNKSDISTQISSSQLQKKNIRFPEFHIQIIGNQTRPLGNLSNNIIYHLRIMIPFYYQEQVNLTKVQEIKRPKQHLGYSYSLSNYKNSFNQRSKKKIPIFDNEDLGNFQQNADKTLKNNVFKCINQRITISFEQIQDIYNELKKIHPYMPDIDPAINQGSYSAKGKRKTKSHQTRKIFIQQFFNYIFRNSYILSSPQWVLSKLKVNCDIWRYSIERNDRLAPYNLKKWSSISYGFDHCILCSKADIKTIEQFQSLRNQYNQKANFNAKKLYCQNFFNLLRIKLLCLPHYNFDSTERVLLYYHYLQGRIDYPFFEHRCFDKTNKIIKIHILSVDERYQQIQIDSKTTAGEVLDNLAYHYDMNNSFDYNLMVQHQKKTYIIDRDEYLINIIKLLEIDFTQCSPQSQRLKLRRSKSKTGLLSALKCWGTKIFQNEQQTKIYFVKGTYLLKSLQTKSFYFYLRKKQLEVQKIFWMIKKSKIKLSQLQLFQIGALFYCLKDFNNIQSFSYQTMSSRLLQKIISDQFSHLFQYKQEFRRKFFDAIFLEREMLYKNQKNKQYLYQRILQFVSQKLSYKTFYIEAQPKQLPTNFSSKLQMTGIYWLGINSRFLIIKRQQLVVGQFRIQQIEYQISVYSIYLTYDKWNFRFDGKMLFYFGEMIRKYKTILQKFPQHVAQNINP